MVAILLQLLLIVALVLCPFRCQTELWRCAEQSGESDVSKPAQCCCSTCGQSDSHREGSESPAPDSGDPCDGSCQCICAGAVFDKSELSGLVNGLHMAICVEREASALPVAMQVRPHTWASPPAASGLNTGRALCTLHCSFLC